MSVKRLGIYLHQKYDYHATGEDAIPFDHSVATALIDFLNAHSLPAHPSESEEQSGWEQPTTAFIEESPERRVFAQVMTRPQSDSQSVALLASMALLAALWLLAQTKVEVDIQYDKATNEKKVAVRLRKGIAGDKTVFALLKAILLLSNTV
ncbi:MAG: hypothetical protein KF743_13225 [Fimbriimonadaceae bacterium]|nr:hypothetical protein [Fimbriimonadaceae bacterium]